MQCIAELEKQLAGTMTKVAEPFSLRAEEKRQKARGKNRKAKRKGRRGRLTTAEKVAQAERSTNVVPDGLAKSACAVRRQRR